MTPEPGAGRDPEDTGLAGVVRLAAARYGDTPLYVLPDGSSLSYAELDARSDALAAGLTERGVTAGDVVALLLPSGAAYAVSYAALSKLGAITAGVNDRLSPSERTACLGVARPRLVLGTSELLQGVELGAVDSRGEVVELPGPGVAAATVAPLAAGRHCADTGTGRRATDRHRLHLGDDGDAQGGGLRRTAARRRVGGGRGPAVGWWRAGTVVDVVRPSRLHDEAAAGAARRGHELRHGPVVGGRGTGHGRAAPAHDARRDPHAGGAHARP